MTRSLRSILGVSGGRVQKRSQLTGAACSPSGRGARAYTHADQSPTATRTRAVAAGTSPSPSRARAAALGEPDDYFDGALPDGDLIEALATDLTLTDVVQAMAAAHGRMFSPLPTHGLGMDADHRVALLQRRAAAPPLATLAHVLALLPSPTAVECELATLTRAGVVRRIGIAHRADAGTAPRELLVRAAHLDHLLAAAADLDPHAGRALARFLADHPTARSVPAAALSAAHAVALVRAGFLVARSVVSDAMLAGSTARVTLRTPTDQAATRKALERVARAASGSLGAVGGVEVARRRRGHDDGDNDDIAPEFDLAVPGQGPFLRLVTAAIDHLTTLLVRRTRFGQAPELVLREWWDCAAARDAARLARGLGGVVLAVRTRKWRQLDGLAFDWALAEAKGAGVVEVFNAGPVGPGVRLV